MRRVALGLLILSVACGRKDDDPTPVDTDDPLVLDPPVGEPPDWTVEPRDLRETWLGYPLAGTHTYRVILTTTNANDRVTEDLDFQETRTYSSDLGIGASALRIEGERMRQPLDAWIGTTDQGWMMHWDPVGQEHHPIWPLDVVEGQRWTAPVLWFRRDNFAFSQFDGEYEVIATDATAPNGTEGCVHVHSTFADDGYTGEWDVWYERGPVVEERTVVNQNGAVEFARSTRIRRN
jgi:hypothetical protein